MNPVQSVWLVGPMAAAVGAVGVMVWGWWGRRVDDHPLCRRCGYDLVGAPVAICSECGADLGRRRARRIGHRRKRRWVIRSSGALLALCVGWFGFLGWAWHKGADLNQYKPVALLRYEARSRKVVLREAAVLELDRRLRLGKLNRQEAQAIADDGVAVAASIRPGFSAGWDLFFQDADAGGTLSDEQWSKYWQVALSVHARVRPVVTMGDGIPAEIRVREPAVTMLTVSSYEVDGVLLKRVSRFSRDENPLAQKLRAFESDLLFSSRQLRAGRHVLSFHVVASGVVARPRGLTTVPHRMVLSVPFELTGRDSVTLRSSVPGQRPIDLAMAVNVGRVHVDRGSLVYEIPLTIDKPPVHLAMQLSIRAGGLEEPLGPMIVPAGKTFSHTFEHYWPLPNVNAATKVDLILRPDPDLVAQTIDLMEIWGEEVVVKDVPLN